MSADRDDPTPDPPKLPSFAEMMLGPQPTAAERIAAHAKVESKYRAMLTHLQAARDALREACSVGAGGPYFRKATLSLAKMIESIELSLRSPTE